MDCTSCNQLLDDLEDSVAAGKRAAQACKELTQAFRDIEEVLDLRRTPDPHPDKTGVPCRVEALVDAWADALMALVDLLANPGSQAARDHANAVLVASSLEPGREPKPEPEPERELEPMT